MPNLTALSYSISSGLETKVKAPPPGSGNVVGVLGNLSAGQQSGRTFQIVLGNGTGSGNASQVYTEARQLAPSANETLTISSGLPDMFGNSAANIGFSIVKGVFYQAVANANGANSALSMSVGNAATPFENFLGAGTSTVLLSAEGPAYVNGNNTGITVTAGVNDGVKVTNNDAGNTLTYIVSITGE